MRGQTNEHIGKVLAVNDSTYNFAIKVAKEWNIDADYDNCDNCDYDDYEEDYDNDPETCLTEVYYRFDQPCMGELSKYTVLHGLGEGRSDYRPGDLFDPFPTDCNEVLSIHVQFKYSLHQEAVEWLFTDKESPFRLGHADNFETTFHTEDKIKRTFHFMGLKNTDATTLIFLIKAIQNRSLVNEKIIKDLLSKGFSLKDSILHGFLVGNDLNYEWGDAIISHPDMDKFLRGNVKNISGGMLGDGFGYNRNHEELFELENHGLTSKHSFRVYYKDNLEKKDTPDEKVFAKCLAGYEDYIKKTQKNSKNKSTRMFA